MTRLAMEYSEFREMVATDYATITTQDREMALTNTNNLLFIYPLATGVKTGPTPAAGSSLVASAAENQSCVSVVLGLKGVALWPRSGRWSTASPPTTA